MAVGLHADIGNIISQAKGFNDLASNLQSRVTQRAVVTLARRIGPEVNRRLAADLNLSTRQISQRVSVTKGPDYVDITGSGKGIALSQFGAKWGGRKTSGAVVQVWRNSQPYTYVGAFITGGRVVSRQRLANGKRAGRLPLRQLIGPDIGSVLIDTGPHQIAGPLLGFARDLLSAEVERLITVEIGNITG